MVSSSLQQLIFRRSPAVLPLFSTEHLAERVRALEDDARVLREARDEARDEARNARRQVNDLRQAESGLQRTVRQLEDQLRARPHDVSGTIDGLREDFRAQRAYWAEAFGMLDGKVSALANAQAGAAEAAASMFARSNGLMEEVVKMTKAQQMEAGVKGTTAIQEEIEVSTTTTSTSDGGLETTPDAGALEVSSANVSFSFVEGCHASVHAPGAGNMHPC